MPSLSALGEFKSSFNDIANERNDVISKNLTFDDFPLPDTEPVPLDLPEGESSGGLSGSDSGAGDFDFSAFFNSLPGEAGPPSTDDIFQEAAPSLDDNVPLDETPPEEPHVDDASFINDLISGMDQSQAPETSETDQGQAPETSGTDDFSVPDELLSGLSDEMESAPPDSQSEDFGAGDFPAEDLNAEEAQSGGDAGGDSGVEDSGAIDMGGETPHGAEDLSGIDMGGESPHDAEDLGGIDLGGESPHDEVSDEQFNLPDADSAAESTDDAESGIDMGGEMPDINTGGETPDLGGEDAGGDFSLDGILPETDFSGADAAGVDSGFESPLPETDFPSADEPPQDDSNFDISMPEPQSEPVEAESATDDSPVNIDFSGFGDSMPDSSIGADSGEMDFPSGSPPESAPVELGDLGSDFESDSIELSGGAEAQGAHGGEDFSGGSFGGEDFGSDDFSLPGLEDIFDKTKTETAPKPVPKKSLFKKKKEKAQETQEAEEGTDEISLRQEDVERILKTLLTYPLNLRIACEELIAEQVILPQQLSKLIHLLVNGASVKEAAALVEEITGKPVVIPKSYQKMTGAAFEAEQSSFAYIFVHNFLPVLRLFAVIAALLFSILYLSYKFIYTPIEAESIYKRGYQRIPAGEYNRANELFQEASKKHRKKKWFYLYAEAFRDQRRYMLAEGKYDELLRYYPRDKKGVLDYANLETYYLMNYEKANQLLQRELLDYAPDDFDGLLAAGDNFLAWADSDPSRFYDKYEDARFSYARLMEKYGWQPSVVERMMMYFIRTDNLKETLYLRAWFENNRQAKLSASSLAELGGYLLDKQLEKPKGVPDPYIESIESVRDMLLQAVAQEPTLPEPHYHLARYHHNLDNPYEERLTLENAIRAFDLAKTESVRRRLYRVDTHYRYANLLIENREFFPAEEQLVRGIELYEDFLSRNLISASPQLGQLYAVKGDLNFFTKKGEREDAENALNDYHIAERYGYAPPEVQYRMGAAYYRLEDWGNALQYLFRASADLPLNRRLLFALGNVNYQRGDYFAAQGYYNRLLDILENQRIRLPVLMPNDNQQFLDLGERLMMARNNAGVVYEALANQTGNREYRSRAMALYSESARAWDSITRNPQTMMRMQIPNIPGAPGVNLGYLNANNALRAAADYTPQVFPRIDWDVLEPSRWEELAQGGDLQ